MENLTHPTKKEYEYLSLAYDRFEQIWQIYRDKDFYNKPAEFRFFCIKDAFSIYSEVISYSPLNSYLTELNANKTPLWLIMNKEFPKIVRNIILHFPFFSKWDDVYVNENLLTWNNSNNKSIHNFFNRYKGLDPISAEAYTDLGTTHKIEINFPHKYDFSTNVFLKDLIDESNGIYLFMSIMKTNMASQLQNLKDSPYYQSV